MQFVQREIYVKNLRARAPTTNATQCILDVACCLIEEERCCITITHWSRRHMEVPTRDSLQISISPISEVVISMSVSATLANWLPSIRLLGVPKLEEMGLTPPDNPPPCAWKGEGSLANCLTLNDDNSDKEFTAKIF